MMTFYADQLSRYQSQLAVISSLQSRERRTPLTRPPDVTLDLGYDLVIYLGIYYLVISIYIAN